MMWNDDPAPAQGLSVRAAELTDLPVLMDLLSSVIEWLSSQGIDQWGPGRFRSEAVAAAIRSGEVFVALRDEEIVATLRLQRADPAIWGERPDNAGYVHALAVRRDCAGQRIGRTLLDWAARQVAAEGRPFLRLDCQADNAALRSYYERAGFHLVDVISCSGWSAALYERAALR